ncbi:hypothetical protein LshimejAT787_3800090 [Lyophyllum shimeji]|uniref:Uncharacterized protein n=1 Tax=Lyophyllum shimeji TaxID=47721 RepID=A0A9P3Q1I5_LYOSH|nr:hypothetical protein LshimejAT787_3800090 [Lyophyllum shimeji]
MSTAARAASHIEGAEKWYEKMFATTADHRNANTPREDIDRVVTTLAQGYADGTKGSNGSGLLAWHVWCDGKDIPEDQRAPASQLLISAFISALPWLGHSRARPSGTTCMAFGPGTCEKSVERIQALFSSSSSAIMAEIQTISLADYSNITKVKNEPTATNRPLQRSAPSPPRALDSKRKKLDVVEDLMANPQEGDERVKETVMEGPSKVLLEDPIANPQDNNEHVKEMAPEGLSEVLVVKDLLAAVFSDPLVAAKLLVPASRPSATTSTASSTIKSSMTSISTEVLACSVPQAPAATTDAIPLNSDNTIRGPVTPAGTNTTTDAATSSGGTKPLSPAPRSVKTVENETVTKDRKASCRDGNTAKSIFERKIGRLHYFDTKIHAYVNTLS